MIRTPDQRLRIFVSSTLGELAEERQAVRRAIERLHLSPVMFELGARPHPPRELYRAYLAQSHVFVGIYWERYGWVAPGEEMSGLEDEYRLADGLPLLVYLKEPAPGREPELTRLLGDIRDDDRASYRRFSTPDELETLVGEDLSLLLSERFEGGGGDETAVTAAPMAPAPVPLTRTFGREEDVARIVDLVGQGERCVTVTGPGGVGKTRVALEVARVLQERGRRVRYVALATATSPELAIATVAEALGVRGSTTHGPLAALAEYFRAERDVLLLDNLEQVVDVRTELAGLLQQAPELQVVATSRQALRMRGEREVVIAPLALPSSDDTGIADSPATALFVDRARALGQPLELDAAVGADIAALCRRLDGLPLALELAAARLRIMTPRMLRERLGSSLDLPAAGSDLPERQRTMRAMLDWSYRLLEPQERSLLARFSVFAGGATLDAVEQVCASGDEDVLEPLAGLLDKSLLVSEAPPEGGEPRLRMLEPVRDYARERLAESGDETDLRRRHLSYVTALGREGQPYLCGPRQREWAVRFDAERANVREAIDAGLQLGESEACLRLVWDTLVYYYIRDATDEPRGWLLRLASRRGELDRVGEALLDVGLVIVGECPDGRESAVVLRRAEEVFSSRGLPLEAAVSLHYLGLRHWYDGDTSAALATLDASSRSYAAIEHDWGVATVELTLGAVWAAGGNRARGLVHVERALELARRIDNRPQIAQALQGLALIHALDGRLDVARKALTEASEIVLQDRSVTAASYCVEALAAVLAAEGDYTAAATCLHAARAVRDRLAVPEWTAAADAAAPVTESVEAALGERWVPTSEEEVTAPDLFGLLRGGSGERDR